MTTMILLLQLLSKLRYKRMLALPEAVLPVAPVAFPILTPIRTLTRPTNSPLTSSYR